MKWLIRDAVPDDCTAILQLIKDLAVFEERPDSVVSITPKVLEQDCFGEEKWFDCLVAEQREDGESSTKREVVGYALYYHAYSTWKGRMLFLEDLYVAPNARKNGIGMAFLSKLSKIAIDRKCYKIKWCVLDWNEQAIDFYEYLGAELEMDWRMVCLDNKAMIELANKKQG